MYICKVNLTNKNKIMAISKKEISILIEIVFSIVFAIIFLPYFYENQDNKLILMDDLIGKIIQILIFTVFYFSVAYSLLELVLKKMKLKMKEMI